MSNPLQEKFTDNLKQTLSRAHDLAWELKQPTVNPEHLLYGLLAYRGSVSSEILNKFQLKEEALRQTIQEKNPIMTTDAVPRLSEETKKIIQRAVLTANLFNHRYVGTEHLLSALLESGHALVKEALTKNSINLGDIQQQLSIILRSTSKFPDITKAFDSAKDFGGPEDMEKVMIAGAGNQGSILELFTTDLTDETTQQDIDPVIGREEEIERVIQVLSRRNKNNPVLLGDPGVGKTAIVEGLAKKILHGDVPDILLDKRILNLDLGLMLAGTMYRGEFEQRLKNMVVEIKRDPEIILFIDEVHTLTGAGAAPGSMDAANILKPALARGEIRCIGATTLEEYRKHIESDAALERRFQPVQVKEPSKDKTIAILQGIKGNYEKFHHVEIGDEAITAAVRLSARYIADRFLPDKAIDLLDEAAARIRVQQDSQGLVQKIKKIERGLDLLERNKRQAIISEQYTEALEYKDQEVAAKEELRAAREEWQKQQKKSLGKITDRDIAELVAKMTGIPLSELVESEKDKILHLEQHLKAHIIGQDEAITELAQAIRRTRAGIALEKRPIGSFIFLGPSGVGKTELAKVLAEELFEDHDALIKIDMSEFRESFNVSKLIGSPPGYVGYRESGALTEAVRRRPYSVVLFDEIEKAHPEIFNILLQVMEDGELTDATGKKINFKNTIIIMTSNVGLKDFVTAKKIGFDDLSGNADLYEEMKGYLEKSLADQFRPEFLNRIDKIIFFRPLGKTHLQTIVTLQLSALNTRLKQQKVKLQTTAKAIACLAQKDFDPQQGARQIRKNIQELVENPLSELLLEKKVKKNGTIKLTVARGTIILV
ncbi:ATP-dependent Clp protease ATP-binding subunit [Candidatus Falkowbacteria bacterium]|nr:ATP-dependent Clp protease ATP-binding subunit [Candidatus Falkowbacteria bacterium]